MNGRERFNAVMNYQPVDRMPVLYFGTWPETKQCWRREGLDVPMPDHRIPPDCSLSQFQAYIKVFKEVFNE